MRPGSGRVCCPLPPVPRAPSYCALPLVLLIKGSPGDKWWPTVTMHGTGVALLVMCLLGSCPHCARVTRRTVDASQGALWPR